MRARNTLIMAIVALLLGAAVYFLEIRGADEREEAERVADRLLRFETEDVTAMTLQTSEGAISLTRADDEWRITAPYDLAADQAAVDAIINRIQGADHERVVEEQPEDLARFGLDEPPVSVSLELADGSRRALQFGDGTPVGFNVFVKRDDADTVYIAAASIKDAVDKTLFDLRDRNVMSFADADIERIEIERDEVTATIEREPDAGDGIARWTLREPLVAGADADTVSSMLQRLRTSNAVAFAADEPTDEQIAEFGLDDPQATVRLWSGDDAVQTLVVGASADEPAGRYARRLGSDAVMIIPDSLVDELPESAAALRNRAVVEFARDRVDAIEVTVADDPSVRLEKDGVDWRIRAPRSLDGDASTVSSLLTAVLNLRTREFPEGSPDAPRFGLDDPHARVSFELEPAPGVETEAESAAEVVTLLIGGATDVDPEEAPAEGEEAEPVAARYVAVDGDATVFVVEQADLEDIEVDLFALRSKTLVSFAQSDVNRLVVDGADGSLELTKSEEGEWAVDGETLADATAVDDLLWRLNYLDMQGIAAEAADNAELDLARWGLASPDLRVRAYTADGGVADVGIGNDLPEAELQDLPPFAAGAQTYATVGGTPGVFRIDAALRDAARTLLASIS